MTCRVAPVSFLLLLSGVVVAGASPALAQSNAGPATPAAADQAPEVATPETQPVPLTPAAVDRLLLDAELQAARAAAIRVEEARMAESLAAVRAALRATSVDAAIVAADAALMAAGQRRPDAGDGTARRSRRAADQEARTYNEGRDAIDKAQWERAIERYTEVVKIKGSRTDAALYWKAFAQDRQGLRADALATIAALGREHPDSRYLQQAKVLEAEIRQKAGQPARPQDQADEDLKLMALNALQHTSPEQAVPMLEKLLHGTAAPRLKERALFVLAQSQAPQAREALKSVAKGNSIPELQSRAITYLALHGGPESRAVLAEVYGSAADVEVRRVVLRAYMVIGDKDRLLSVAQTEQNADLRAEAVRQLGAMNAHTELTQLYEREGSVEVKKQILRAMFVGGDASRMIELARTEQSPELRREAIRNLGQMGPTETSGALVEIYAAERDADVRRDVIQALGIQDNAAALVALARKEQDQSMRAEIVRRLSVMDNNKIATDYMLEILGGR